MVIAEADGSARRGSIASRRRARGAGRGRDLGPRPGGDGARSMPSGAGATARGLVIGAERGGKVSEDIVVPLDRLAEAIEETLAIGARHGLVALSWGHAGDGNLHSTFLVDPADADRGRARRARRRGALRPRRPPRRLGHRRARRRLGQARPARAPVVASRRSRSTTPSSAPSTPITCSTRARRRLAGPGCSRPPARS